MQTPYSYARGVLNTRVTVSDDDTTLADLRARFKRPVTLTMRAKEYHGSGREARTTVKKSLPYFVGGTIEGKRHDSNVRARTMLTLDIEAPSPKKNESEAQRKKREAQGYPPDPREVLEYMEQIGVEGWVYTSLSHTEDEPRYRVVLPLERPITGTQLNEDTMRASTQAAAEVLGIKQWCTPESWVLSQPMYLPAKLHDGPFWEGYTAGKAWRTAKATPKEVVDFDDAASMDPVLRALQRAGLYLQEDPQHKGKHFITCPFADQHGQINDTQTVYYEAHHDGNPRPAVKCFDTDPDEDGVPHLTYKTLVNWLRDGGHLEQQDENEDTATALEDYDTFTQRASIGQYLEQQPKEREFAWERFAPVGKVTVLAGPGGVSKSMLMLHMLVHGALGRDWAGFKVKGQLRGLYASYEDDTLELHKRVHGLAQALKDEDDGLGAMLYDIDGALRKNLFLYAADEDAIRWLLMTKPDPRKGPERTARVEWLVGYLRHAGIKALVLDPVVYTHTLEENDSGEMALYMQMLTYIAKTAGCAIVVLHHMHKNAQWASLDDVNQGSMRGASAFADNSRSVGVLVTIPATDAARYGLTSQDRGQYAVFKHVKHNYSAPLPPVVFERRGALLHPRLDITPMTGEQVKEAAADAKEAAQARKLESRCRVLLDWLTHNPQSSTNMVRAGTGIRFSLVKSVVERALAEGWLDTSRGPNNSTLFEVSSAGAEWLEAQNAE